MALCFAKEENGFVKFYDERNMVISSATYGLSGYKKFLGHTDTYFVIQDGSVIRTFDENKKQLGTAIPCIKPKTFEGIAGNNIHIQVDASWIWIYDKYGKRVGTVSSKRKINNENTSQNDTNRRKSDVGNIRVPRYLIPLIIAVVILYKLFEAFSKTFGLYFYNLSFILVIFSLVILPIGLIILSRKIKIPSKFIKTALPISISILVFVFLTMFKYKYLVIIPILLLWIGYSTYIASKLWQPKKVILLFFTSLLIIPFPIWCIFLIREYKYYQDDTEEIYYYDISENEDEIKNNYESKENNKLDIIIKNNHWICGNCGYKNDNKTISCKKCNKRFGMNGFKKNIKVE